MLRSARQQGPDVRQWTDAAHNCTDLLDAAGLAVDCQLAGSVTAVCPDGSSLWSLASAPRVLSDARLRVRVCGLEFLYSFEESFEGFGFRV